METVARQVAGGTQLEAARDYAGTGWMSGARTHVRPDEVTTMRRSVVLGHAPEKVLDLCLSREGFPAMMPDPFQLQWSSSHEGQVGGTYDFTWRFKGLVPIRWTAFIDSYTEGREFSDLQVRGMFRYYHHTHSCDPHPQGCLYTDTVDFRSLLGPRLDRIVLLPQVRSLFAYRHGRMGKMLALQA